MERKRLNKKMILQRDGAPSHFSKEARTWFNETFHEKWIGRASLISWPARSPNLTPLDAFPTGIHFKKSIQNKGQQCCRFNGMD